MEDEQIIELFVRREEQGIRELDAKYGRAFYALSYQIVGDRQDAEECVNDTYLGAWNAIPPGQAGPADDLYLQDCPERFAKALLQERGRQAERPLYSCHGGD